MTEPRGQLPRTRAAWLRFAGWTYVVEMLLVLFISLNYLRTADLPSGPLAHVFTPLMFLGQMATLAFVAFLPVFVTAALRPRRGLMIGVTMLMGTVLVTGVGLDVLVYQQYRFHIDASILHLVFGGAAGEIFVFSGHMYLQMALIMVVMVLLQWAVVWGVEKMLAGGRRPMPGLVVGLALFSVALAENGIFAWADASGYVPVVRQAGLMPAYFPVTDRPLFAKYGITSKHVPGGALASGNFHYPEGPMQCKAPAKPMNVVFLLLDSWRFDALSPKASPHMYSFAKNNVRFLHHFSGGSCTRTGIFSMMYGLPGTYWHAALSSDTSPVLTRQLLKDGYNMGIYGSAPITSPDFTRTAFNGVPNLRRHSKARKAVNRDREITRLFIQFLDKQTKDKPFFGWVFYDGPHAYAVPKNEPLVFKPSWDHVDYLALGPDFDPTPFHNRYLNSVHFDDELVGRILDAMKQKGVLDNTVVIISGDHGQEFNDTGRNFWGHNSNFSRYQTQVPMVVHWPGRGAATVDYRTSHFDIAPTLLNRVLGCGATDPKLYTVGHDLFKSGGRNFLLMANYNDYGIKTPNETIMIHPYNAIDVVGPNYQPLHKQPDPNLIRRALRERSYYLHAHPEHSEVSKQDNKPKPPQG